MLSFLKNLFSRSSAGNESPFGAPGEAVSYKGFRIRPAPYPSKGQFQTAGIIEKVDENGTREHRFIRAETHPSRDDAATFAIAKAKQIIDEQGDRLFS